MFGYPQDFPYYSRRTNNRSAGRKFATQTDAVYIYRGCRYPLSHLI